MNSLERSLFSGLQHSVDFLEGASYTYKLIFFYDGGGGNNVSPLPPGACSCCSIVSMYHL